MSLDPGGVGKDKDWVSTFIDPPDSDNSQTSQTTSGVHFHLWSSTVRTPGSRIPIVTDRSYVMSLVTEVS